MAKIEEKLKQVKSSYNFTGWGINLDWFAPWKNSDHNASAFTVYSFNPVNIVSSEEPLNFIFLKKQKCISKNTMVTWKFEHFYWHYVQ